MLKVGQKLRPKPHVRDREEATAVVQQHHMDLGYHIIVDGNFGAWYKTPKAVWLDFEAVPVEKTKLDPDERKVTAHFCVRCLGSSDNSSWGEAVGPGYCMNCGASGSTVEIPRWAVESIREQASWVGKRYYPNEEDLETNAEIQLLRAVAPDDPRRTVIEDPDDPRRFTTKQPTKTGWISTMVTADNMEEARKKAQVALPYLPPEEDP